MNETEEETIKRVARSMFGEGILFTPSSDGTDQEAVSGIPRGHEGEGGLSGVSDYCAKYGFASFGQVLEHTIEEIDVSRKLAALTESPIEAMFGIAATKVFTEHGKSHPHTRFEQCQQEAADSFSEWHVLMIPQFWWRNYRIDWAFQVNFLKQRYFFVECDGHEFHSSDEQILKDVKRDLEICASGIPVLRFTGREIFKNSEMCARAVIWEIQRQDRLELRRAA